MKWMLLLAVLTGCSHSSSSPQPFWIQGPIGALGAIDRDCESQATCAFIGTNTAVTASHAVANLDNEGRTACELAVLYIDGQHGIPLEVFVDGEPATVLSFSMDDEEAAVVFTEVSSEHFLPTGDPVYGPGELVLSETERYPVTVLPKGFFPNDRYDGPPSEHGWSGAPVVQGGKVVGVVTHREATGGDIARIPSTPK